MEEGDPSAVVQDPCSMKERHFVEAVTGEAQEEAEMEVLHGEEEEAAWAAWAEELPPASV